MSAATKLNILTTSGSVGTATAVTALAAASGTGKPREILVLQNTHTTQFLYYTLDGTTPSASVGFVLGPVSATGTAGPCLSFHQYVDCVPQGAVTMISNGNGTTYTIGSN